MFTLHKQDADSGARLGKFVTRHGSVDTPAFFPVATQAAVKGLSTADLGRIGVSGLLVNAYHMFLRPGTEVVKSCGGLHKFMDFSGTIITDSGGYQIFSLERLRKVADEGVKFQSHIDGRTIFLAPEDVIRIQIDLGADIIVPLDECIKYPSSKAQAQEAANRTVLWARRSKDFFQKNKNDDVFFMGIIQGSTYRDLRQECLDALISLELDGFCIGGLSVGEPQDLRYNILSFIGQKAPKSSLRYFMGYGKPLDIIEAVSCGADLFDCVIPTRFARTGTAYTWEGKLVVRNSPFISDNRPLDENCGCYVCRNFSRAYLRHLINAGEILGIQLLAFHNLFWYNTFLARTREAIRQDKFTEFKKDFLLRFEES